MKKSRYNCTWQPVTQTNPDGYTVNRHVYTRNFRTKLSKLYKEKLSTLGMLGDLLQVFKTK